MGETKLVTIGILIALFVSLIIAVPSWDEEYLRLKILTYMLKEI